jgi:hypothetical protein
MRRRLLRGASGSGFRPALRFGFGFGFGLIFFLLGLLDFGSGIAVPPSYLAQSGRAADQAQRSGSASVRLFWVVLARCFAFSFW